MEQLLLLISIIIISIIAFFLYKENKKKTFGFQNMTTQLTSDVKKYDILEKIADRYNIQYLYKDDFNLGPQGWQYQFGDIHFTGITMTEDAMTANYALEMHTAPAINSESWCRKGLCIPNGAKKIVFGCYWMFHGENTNSPERLKFECDCEDASKQRHFFSFSYLNYKTGESPSAFAQKWQVNTGEAGVYTSVANGNQLIPWNEGNKPMLSYFVGVIDTQNWRYERIFSNGLEIDVTAYSPNSSNNLNYFENGCINIYAVKNRADSATEGQMIIEKPFLGFVM